MRKVKLQIQMTINGFVGGADGQNDWMTFNPDPEFVAFLDSLLDDADTLLIGRNLADGFIEYWAGAAEKDPAPPFAKKIAALPKIVFTQSLTESAWNNTRLAKGDLVEEIANLKKQKGKDMLVFGGGAFVSSLVKAGLIDEYHLIINPTAMSTGMTIFGMLDKMQKFTPLQSKLYPGGKTVLSFVPKLD